MRPRLPPGTEKITTIRLQTGRAERRVTSGFDSQRALSKPNKQVVKNLSTFYEGTAEEGVEIYTLWAGEANCNTSVLKVRKDDFRGEEKKLKSLLCRSFFVIKSV